MLVFQKVKKTQLLNSFRWVSGVQADPKKIIFSGEILGGDQPLPVRLEISRAVTRKLVFFVEEPGEVPLAKFLVRELKALGWKVSLEGVGNGDRGV